MVAAVAAHPTGTMKAIVQEGYGSAEHLHFREVDRPAITDDRVLVRVRAASVNAVDRHFVRGEVYVRPISGLRGPKRRIRGVDVAGVVEAVGKSVTRFVPGDEVGTSEAARHRPRSSSR